MELTNEFEAIRKWAKERGIFTNGSTESQFEKLLEEVDELEVAITEKNREEFIDAIGDCVVVLTNLAFMQGISIEDCINSAYNEIKNRKGKIENGCFVKE